MGLEDAVENQPDTRRQSPHDSTYEMLRVKSRDKVEWWVPGAGARRKWGNYLMGAEVQFHKMKSFLEMDRADGCTLCI